MDARRTAVAGLVAPKPVAILGALSNQQVRDLVETLKQLKASGLPQSVIMAMVKAG
jgi:hypothetical protein